jgi:uncharacterized membrane protein YedE/YeeE
MLNHQLPWFLAGPLLGLCVVAYRALFNGRLGVTGGFTDIVQTVGRRSLRLDRRGWVFAGLLVGGAAFGLAAGGPDFHGYGWLTDTFSSPIAVGAILVACGVLVGYGAKVGGGCTSGNGLSGNAMLSPAALAATATFFGVAIVVSFVTEALI